MLEINDRVKILPQWAQTYIESLKRQVDQANEKKDIILKMHAIFCDADREWFTVRNDVKGAEPMKLWLLDKDHPFPVCSVGPKDILFIGRATKHV